MTVDINTTDDGTESIQILTLAEARSRGDGIYRCGRDFLIIEDGEEFLVCESGYVAPHRHFFYRDDTALVVCKGSITLTFGDGE